MLADAVCSGSCIHLEERTGAEKQWGLVSKQKNPQVRSTSTAVFEASGELDARSVGVHGKLFEPAQKSAACPLCCARAADTHAGSVQAVCKRRVVRLAKVQQRSYDGHDSSCEGEVRA